MPPSSLDRDQVKELLSSVDPRDASYVLWHYGHRVGTIEPGSFFQRLLSAIAAADMWNKANLARGFPGLVAAAIVMEGSPDGVVLLRKAAGIPCPDCSGTGMVRDLDPPPLPDGGRQHLKDCPICHGNTVTGR